MRWIIAVHDGNRTVRRARRKSRDQNGTVPSLMARQVGYIVLQLRLGGWTIPSD